MFYLVKTPWWLRLLYNRCVWQLPAGPDNVLYLTFDDGPHPEATPFVLDILRQYNAKATFFCIGKNVLLYPQLYRQLLTEGHRLGNHTHHHLNGWKTADEQYDADATTAAACIDSNLFRPPYGKITRRQINKLQDRYKIIMWSVLSGDFDPAVSGEKCLRNVLGHADNGSIVVFHDSTKAFEKLKYALPVVLQTFSERGFRFETVP